MKIMVPKIAFKSEPVQIACVATIRKRKHRTVSSSVKSNGSGQSVGSVGSNKSLPPYKE